YGKTNMNLASRFIEEIPDVLVEKTEPETVAIGSSTSSFTESRNRPIQPVRKSRRIVKQASTTGAENQTWSIGDKATHKKWGLGTIVAVKGDGEEMELDVAFPDEG